jgi:hypothetical protein
MWSWKATGFALATIGLACCLPTDGCGCTPTPATAVLFGRVQTSEGAPVDQAIVFAYIAQGTECGRRETPEGQGQTGSDGTYRIDIAGLFAAESTCVLVRVRAPTGSTLLDAPDTAVTLALRFGLPSDSARVDATLAAAP